MAVQTTSHARRADQSVLEKAAQSLAHIFLPLTSIPRPPQHDLISRPSRVPHRHGRLFEPQTPVLYRCLPPLKAPQDGAGWWSFRVCVRCAGV